MSTLKVDAIQGSDGTSRNVAVQRVYTQTGAAASTTTTMPSDDTIPQITEGAEMMTLTITPKSATNILVITVTTQLVHSAANSFNSAALFVGSTADALAVSWHRDSAGGYGSEVSLTHTVVAGVTTALTFRTRCGGDAAGTLTFNGYGGGRRFGGVASSSMTITEYEA